jgi:hypothetical protein
MKPLKALFCALFFLCAAALHAQDKMYWTDFANQKMQRANLDGTSIENIFDHQSGGVEGIALDLAAGKIYVSPR